MSSENMPPRKEIEEVLRWCRDKKASSKTVPIVEMNPFREKYSWLFSRIRVAIDLPLEDAKGDMLVYDSPTDALYVYVNGKWMRVEPDDIFEL